MYATPLNSSAVLVLPSGREKVSSILAKQEINALARISGPSITRFSEVVMYICTSSRDEYLECCTLPSSADVEGACMASDYNLYAL